MPKLAAKFEEWTWPWKKGEVDEERAARLIYNLTQERDDYKDKHTESSAQLVAVTAERDTLKDQIETSGAKADGKDAEINDLKKAAREALAKADKLEKEGRAADVSTIARLQVALEKGLTASQAKRLVGETKDEIEADADELLKDLGISESDDEQQGAEQGAKGTGFGFGQYKTGTTEIGSAKYETDPSKVVLPPL